MDLCENEMYQLPGQRSFHDSTLRAVQKEYIVHFKTSFPIASSEGHKLGLLDTPIFLKKRSLNNYVIQDMA